MFGLRDFSRLAIGNTSPETLESAIKQRDLGMAEGPVPVGSQKFVAPQYLISKADNLEIVLQRTFLDEADKNAAWEEVPQKEESWSREESRR